MEIDQSRRHGSGPDPVSGGAGMARPQGERGAGETVNPPVLLLAAALTGLGAPALAQSPSEIPAPPKSPPAAKRPQAPLAPPAPAKATVADTWFVTETTSPLDYSPIAIATATAPAGADGATMSLSVQCRGGRTDMVVAGAAIQRGPQDATVTYMVNAGAPGPVAVGLPPSAHRF